MKGWGLLAVGIAALLSAGPSTAGAATMEFDATADADPSLVLPIIPHGDGGVLRTDIAHDAYVRFDVSGVDRTVLQGTLLLQTVEGTRDAVAARAVGADWTDDSLTYLGAQHSVGRALDRLHGVQAGATAAFDVTHAVQDGDGAYGFSLSGPLLDPATFLSREAGAGGPLLSLVLATSAQDALARIVGDPLEADIVRYAAHDDRGARLDALKVITAPPGAGPRYLGVYHYDDGGTFVTALAASNDLVTWRRVRDLERQASQATIALIPGGGVLVAEEADAVGADGVNRGHVRFLRWGSAAALLNGEPPADAFDAPRSLSDSFEGTPEIAAIDPAADRITVRFHYLSGAHVDRVATGVLRGFLAGSGTPAWIAARDDRINDPVRLAGATANIGDLDEVTFNGAPLTVVEGQTGRHDFGTFSPYVVDPATTVAERVKVHTAGGSRSFGNPTVTMLTGPDGKPGILVTMFVFGEGAAPGESGELIFFRAL